MTLKSLAAKVLVFGLPALLVAQVAFMPTRTLMQGASMPSASTSMGGQVTASGNVTMHLVSKAKLLFMPQIRIPGPGGGVAAAPFTGWTVLQTTSRDGAASSSSTVVTSAMPGALTAGTIICLFSWDRSGNSGVFSGQGDTGAGNTYTDVGDGTNQNPNGERSQVSCGLNTHTNTGVTFHSSAGGLWDGNDGLTAVEFSCGATCNGAVDGHVFTSGSSTQLALTTPNMPLTAFSTAAANSLVIGFYNCNDGSKTSDGGQYEAPGYTKIVLGNTVFVEYQTLVAAGSITINAVDDWANHWGSLGYSGFGFGIRK